MKRIAIAALAIALAGCATGYQAKGAFSSGYSDVQIDENTYRVSYEGNGFTGKEEVDSMLIYRSADLTVQRGYDWFMMSDKGDGTKWVPQYGNIGMIASAEIKMFKGKKPDTVPGAYDAKSVLAVMSAKK
jgi:hypothetical protein